MSAFSRDEGKAAVQRMIMREMCLCVLIGLFLLDLSACFDLACSPAQCVICKNPGDNLTSSCPPCSERCVNVSQVSPNCTKEFQVWINSTGSEVNEGNRVTLTCLHNLPKVTLVIGWKMDEKELTEERNESLILESVLTKNAGMYACFVNSSCGFFESPTEEVTVANGSVVILIICGVSALAFILLMGGIMKYKLKRDNAKHRERMKKREENQQGAGPAPIIPRES